MKYIKTYENYQLNENVNQEDIEELLKKHGFKQSTISNEYSKGEYKAVVWKNRKVTITKYSPKQKRHLHSNTYNNMDDLKQELEKNHPI